ncbi:MAG TPA: hypothetical protein VFW66_03235 [Gemmatimonadales bacterium]|nr:hypothetical protein [Gemmatimonadales bacterium]
MPSAPRAESPGSKLLTCLGLVGVVALLLPRSLHAYVDPSVGSIVFQVAAAGFLAGLLTAKRWWRRATSLVHGLVARIAGR